jgi:hypothetical protein
MFVVVIAATLAGVNGVASVHTGRAFLGSSMQPEVVAKTLISIEEEWRAQAALFSQCNSTGSMDGGTIVDCQDAPNSFGKSCRTVVAAIVQGSDGDNAVAKEYMSDVCGQTVMLDWHKQHCLNLAEAVKSTMTADAYQNRNNFNSKKLCDAFWSEFVGEEQKRLAAEKAEREAAEKKAEEEEKVAKEAAEKKAQEEAAERARKAEEEAKIEAERKKVEDAAKQKAEAEAKAKEAADRLAQKKAEAEAMAKAAQDKIDEARQAEQEHMEAIAKVQATQNNGTETGAVNQSSVHESEQDHGKSDAKSAASSPSEVSNNTVAVVNATVATVQANKTDNKTSA